MRSVCAVLVSVFFLLIAVNLYAEESNDISVKNPKWNGQKYVPGELIVKFKPGVGEDIISGLNKKYRASHIRESRFSKFRRLKVPDGKGVEEMAKIYAADPDVEYAEPNYIAYASSVPNDPLYVYQWHLKAIGMEAAWDAAPNPGSGVIVAVVDTGVAYENYTQATYNSRTRKYTYVTYAQAPDLASTLFVPGYDFVNEDTHPNDDEGHGTHVTGTIAQSTNNALGAAGVAYACSIMPVKVLDKAGSGTYADIADGIQYAADHGAKVINMSLGGSSNSITLENAVAYAYNKGVTIVCASGNDGSNTAVSYPAAYDAYCIAVGATRYDGAVASYSNKGASLDITAPGGDMSVDQNGDGYTDGVLQQTHDGANYSSFSYWFYQGTSMAAPHVSGVAALLISRGVAVTPAEVRNVLQSTAKDKGAPGWDPQYGYGIVDAYAALNYSVVPNDPPYISPAVPDMFVAEDQVFTYDLTQNEKDYQDLDAGLTWSISGVNTALFSASIDPATDMLTITPAADANGSDLVTLTLRDSGGLTASQDVNITVQPVNDAPIANAKGPYTGVVNSAVQFDGSGSSDIDNDTLTYSWDFGDSSTAGVVNPAHTYNASGTYTITLAVNDGTVSSTPSITTATITEQPVLTMRVSSISMSLKTQLSGRNKYTTASAVITVLDKNGTPVQGASVSGNWSGATFDADSGVTNSSGKVTVSSDAVKNAPRGLVFTFTINTVSKTGYTYDPSGKTTGSITVK